MTPSLASTDDLALLPTLDEEAVLSALSHRYSSGCIYTYVHEMLLSLNPYAELGLYTHDMLQRYSRHTGPPPSPHAFAVAANAFRGILDGRSQSVLVTGESGAGKTETCRRLLQYLAHAATIGGSRGTQRLHEALGHTSCVLEAFGNARTVMNDNSSRYGKFLMLQYDSTAKLRAAAFSTFLLEKTRVVRLAPGERNYHVFYALLAGLKPLEAAELQLTHEPAAAGGTLRVLDARAFQYTRGSSSINSTNSPAALKAEAERDKTALREMGRALEALGLAHYDQWQAWRLLAAVLHLGNLKLAPAARADGSTAEAAELRDAATLSMAAKLLGLSPEALSGALLSRCIKAGAEYISTPYSAAEAVALRDGLAKALYARLFDRVVSSINTSPNVNGSDDDGGADGGLAKGIADKPRNRPFIGMLDIFGFEDFETNSLEQLLINYSNEHMQAIFNEIIFLAAQAEAAEEGVPLPVFDAEAVSNSSTLSLFSTPHRGLFSLLNEECVFPKGTDISFTAKFAAANKDNLRLQLPPPAAGEQRGASFAVTHYAGTVCYSSHGFLLKNKDPFSEDLLVLLRTSTEPFVASLFAPPPHSKGEARGGRLKSGRGFRGVVGKYATELEELLRVIRSSRAHFIRCIKPNTLKAASRFEREVVLRQLRCGGVIEAVRVFSSGYPDRFPIREFVGTYRAILPASSLPPPLPGGKASDPTSEGERRTCAVVLSALGISESSFALGKTKLFLAAGVEAYCRAMRDEKIAACVVSCQAGARGLLARHRTREARSQHEARVREEGRQREIVELEARQEAERAAARQAADARAALLRAKEKEARQREEEEVAAAAARVARQSASWEVREAELHKVNASLAAESGRKQAELRAQLDSLTQQLRVAEEKSSNLEIALGQERAVAAAQEAELQSAVCMWRDEAGMASVREKQAVEMAEAKLAQAEEKVGELRDEVAFFRARFQELALSVSRGEFRGTSQKDASRAGGGNNFLEGISSWAGILLGGSGMPSRSSRARGRSMPPPPPPPPPGGPAPTLLAERPVLSPSIFPIAENEELWTPRLRSPPKGSHGRHKSARASGAVVTRAYALYLGLDPDRDTEHMWIAEAAATEPLPDGWSESRDPEGRPYYHNSVTGEASRQHPRDDDFRQLAMRAKLNSLHSSTAAKPSAGDWSTVQMKSIEQSLCSAASAPVRALVQLASVGGTLAPPRFTFEMLLDEDTRLTWMDAVLCDPPRLNLYQLGFEEAPGDVREHFIRLHEGTYTLLRRPRGKTAVGGHEEELAAVIFNKDVQRMTQTMELVVPKMRKDGVVVAHVSEADGGSLVQAYIRGETCAILVFVGEVRIDVPPNMPPNYGVRLSLPKTDSGNLLLQRLGRHGPGRVFLEYHEPLAPIQAFLCALALIHWSDGTGLQQAPIPRDKTNK